MQVAKWGNSLAIRLPSAVVQALDLQAGDEIEIRVAGERAFEIARDSGRERALERIRQLRRPLPPDFKFDRLSAYERLSRSSIPTSSFTLSPRAIQEPVQPRR